MYCNDFPLPIADLTIPFLTIALAELGDKSQVLVFLLSSRTKSHLRLLAGVMLGFLMVDGCAILVGSWVVQLVPAFWLKLVAGLVFLVLGLMMILAKHDGKEAVPHLKNPFLTGFSMILMAEWGDKTQIASAVFAATYNPVLVFIAVLAALLLLSASAIYLGKFIARKFDAGFTTKAAGIVFVGIGLFTLFLR